MLTPNTNVQSVISTMLQLMSSRDTWSFTQASKNMNAAPVEGNLLKNNTCRSMKSHTKHLSPSNAKELDALELSD